MISIGQEYKERYEDAERKLAALREELAECKRDRDREQYAAIEANSLLKADEQRNVELVGLLEELLDPTKFVPRERIRAALAQPTESGASE